MITTNQLIQTFLPVLQSGLLAMGYTSPVVIVKQDYQPTQQGANTGPTVYFHKIGDHRYGFMGAHDSWDATGSVENHTETQVYETTFQVSALVISQPKITNTYTASDLVNSVAQILASRATLYTLNAAGMSILRIGEVRHPYFTDDRDNYEAIPSFDFTLTYTQTYVTQVNTITGTDVEIYGI